MPPTLSTSFMMDDISFPVEVSSIGSVADRNGSVSVAELAAFVSLGGS